MSSRAPIRYVPLLVLLGGAGGTATALLVGMGWQELLFGSAGRFGLPALIGLVLALPAGFTLGKLDETLTRTVYRRMQGLHPRAVHGVTADAHEDEDTWGVLRAYFLYTLGEEGLRAGLLGLLLHWLALPSLPAILVGGLVFGLLHGFYGLPAIPSKILDQVVFFLVLFHAGIPASFLIHASLNFYMLFDVRVIRSREGYPGRRPCHPGGGAPIGGGHKGITEEDEHLRCTTRSESALPSSSASSCWSMR